MWVRIFGQDALHAVTEILILWLMFYVILKASRVTRAFQVAQFFILLLAVTHLCQMLNLSTVYWFLSSAQLPIFVALTILYAPEMRRSITELTHFRLFTRSRKTEDPTIEEVAKAVHVLSRRRIGALIVFERSSSLQMFIDIGIAMDCKISQEVIVTIFSPLTPLHDGALIIRNQLIAAAACILRVSMSEGIDSAYASRHRAALGLAEETDALVVIVSEETGGISLAINGRITRDIDSERLQSMLVNILARSKKA